MTARWSVRVEDDGPDAAETYAPWREEISRVTERCETRLPPGPFRTNSDRLETPVTH